MMLNRTTFARRQESPPPLTIDSLREMALTIRQLAAPQPMMRIVESPYLTEDIGHWIDVIPVTRQPRSKRLWKKLRRRRQRNARLMIAPMRDALHLPDGSLVMHTEQAALLRRELAARCETQMARSVHDAMFSGLRL